MGTNEKMLRTLVSLAASDGSIGRHELLLINKIGAGWGLPERTISDAVAKAASGELRVSIPTDSLDQSALIGALAEVAATDGVLHPRERLILDGVAKRMGLAPVIVQTLVENCLAVRHESLEGATEAESTASGHVYALINDSFPGQVKIGFTARDPATRAKELSGTGLPWPFSVAFSYRFANARTAEKHIHSALAEYRTNLAREFFSVSLEAARDAFRTERQKHHTGAPQAEMQTFPSDAHDAYPEHDHDCGEEPATQGDYKFLITDNGECYHRFSCGLATYGTRTNNPKDVADLRRCGVCRPTRFGGRTRSERDVDLLLLKRGLLVAPRRGGKRVVGGINPIFLAVLGLLAIFMAGGLAMLFMTETEADKRRKEHLREQRIRMGKPARAE